MQGAYHSKTIQNRAVQTPVILAPGPAPAVKTPAPAPARNF